MEIASLSLAAACSLAAFLWANCIEPNRVQVSSVTWKVPKKYAHLDGLKIAQISDLHMHRHVPESFLNKVLHKLHNLAPDILVFSGDFICRAKLENLPLLHSFLHALHAPLGTYAILGNHDYQAYISRNIRGKIDVIPPQNSQPITRAFVAIFQCLFGSTLYDYASDLQPQEPHAELMQLLRTTSITLLHNASHQIPDLLNIVGLGDLFAKQFHPEQAFAHYNPTLPGLILSHNPDSFPHLRQYPGDIILSGHSHGAQIFIPWPKFAKRLTSKLSGLENPLLLRGLFSFPDIGKQLYVNRGLGGLKRIRVFSPPEISLIKCVYAS